MVIAVFVGLALALAALALVVGRARHEHHPESTCRRGWVGEWEVCRCGACRMVGDRRWRRRPAWLPARHP